MSSRNSRKADKGRVITKARKPSQSLSSPASKDNENYLSMSKFGFLLFLTLAIACSVFGSSGAAPAKSASCQNDNDCAEGQYCYAKYGPSYCTDCLDCGAYNRNPGIGQCAQKRTECGDCYPGFVKVGIQCSRNAKDITTSEYPDSGYIPPNKPTSPGDAINNSIFEVKNLGNINHTGEFQSDRLMMPPGHNNWIVIATMAILSVVVVMGLVVMYCRRPLIVRAGPHLYEELELQTMSGDFSTQSSDGGYQGPTAADLSPSAPPEEYLQKPPAYWSGSYTYAGHTHNGCRNKGPKLTGPSRIVAQMADILPVTEAAGIERLVPESNQQANPFAHGNAAGEEAQAFLAHQDLDQEAIYEDDPHPMLELLENELRHIPAAVQLPPQQVPEVHPENPEAAASHLGEVSMDISGIDQIDDEDMDDIDDGIPDDDNEFSLEISFDLALIPANHLENHPAGGDARDEPENDSGIVDDAVVPASLRTTQDGHENNPGDDDGNNSNNNNGRDNRLILSVNQPPAVMAHQFLDQLNVQLVNADNWMRLERNEGLGHHQE